MKKIIFILLLVTHCSAFSAPLSVGFLRFSPPYSNMTNKNLFFGFNIDLMDAICQKLRQKCVYKPIMLNQQFADLDEGVVDLIFSPNPLSTTKTQHYIFSLPYLNSDAQFVTLKSSTIDDLADLKNKKIGVIAITYYPSLAKTHFATENHIIQYKVVNDMIPDLMNHKIDAIIINAHLAKYILGYNNNTIKAVGNKIPLGEGFGIMSLPKNKALIEQINKILEELEADGTYLTIYKRYF
ncbi:MAG: transporter substrate-binding domain-containing protein [bacterium]|nr:transporter substrate-binding domain-containing protein [bacterium]